MRGGLRLFFFGKSVFVKHPNQHASAAVALRRLLVYSKDQKDDIDYADGWWYGDVG